MEDRHGKRVRTCNTNAHLHAGNEEVLSIGYNAGFALTLTTGSQDNIVLGAADSVVPVSKKNAMSDTKTEYEVRNCIRIREGNLFYLYIVTQKLVVHRFGQHE